MFCIARGSKLLNTFNSMFRKFTCFCFFSIVGSFKSSYRFTIMYQEFTFAISNNNAGEQANSALS